MIPLTPASMFVAMTAQWVPQTTVVRQTLSLANNFGPDAVKEQINHALTVTRNSTNLYLRQRLQALYPQLTFSRMRRTATCLCEYRSGYTAPGGCTLCHNTGTYSGTFWTLH